METNVNGICEIGIDVIWKIGWYLEDTDVTLFGMTCKYMREAMTTMYCDSDRMIRRWNRCEMCGITVPKLCKRCEAKRCFVQTIGMGKILYTEDMYVRVERLEYLMGTKKSVDAKYVGSVETCKYLDECEDAYYECWGAVPMYYYASKGLLDVIKYVYERGLCAWDNQTSYEAERNGHLDVMRYVLMNGGKDRLGRTLIEIGTYYGMEDLIEKGRMID